MEVFIIYTDRDPVGPYKITVGARRLRRIRVNDLIDPARVPLETDYAVEIRSSQPIVVQFTRVDSGSARTAITGSMAFPG